MLKISAHISKKVPLPERQYSSQQFGASLEIEVSDASKPEEVQQRLRQLYSVISKTIDEQISQASNGSCKPNATTAATSRTNGNGGGNGNGNSAAQPRNGALATQAQQRAIHALSKRAGMDVVSAVAVHGVADPAALSVRQASELIDSLKARSGAN